jgi:hypothetical protein
LRIGLWAPISADGIASSPERKGRSATV